MEHGVLYAHASRHPMLFHAERALECQQEVGAIIVFEVETIAYCYPERRWLFRILMFCA